MEDHLSSGYLAHPQQMYTLRRLTILVQWRSMASGDYACGLEPGNSYIMGRKQERENGTLPVLKPFETVKTEVSIRFESI